MQWKINHYFLDGYETNGRTTVVHTRTKTYFQLHCDSAHMYAALQYDVYTYKGNYLYYVHGIWHRVIACVCSPYKSLGYPYTYMFVK